MKKIALILILIVSAMSSAQTTSLQNILNVYLQVKDALVEGDARLAADRAGKLFASIYEMANTTSPASEKESFNKVKDKLLKAATNISKTINIETQRAIFANLSTGMWELITAGHRESRQVYYQYCPMKKAYWLSIDADIRNPYYGETMLTCGSISDKTKR